LLSSAPDDQPLLQQQKHSLLSRTLPQEHYDALESEILHEHAFNANAQPPPYGSDNKQNLHVMDSYVDWNGYPSSDSNWWAQNPQTPNLQCGAQRISTPKNTETHRPRKIKGKGARSSTDRRHRTVHDEKTHPNSTGLPWVSPLLEKALKQLYPDYQTFREGMENLIHAYYASMGKNPSTPLSSYGMNILSLDKGKTPGKWDETEQISIRTKLPPYTVSSEPSDTNSDSGLDDENEHASYKGNSSDLEMNTEVLSESEVDQALHLTDTTGRAVACRQDVRAPLPSRSPNMPDVNEKISVDTKTTQRFACPFYQRNAAKHQVHRSCAGPGFETVHRTK
jgi:hypothetical protein